MKLHVRSSGDGTPVLLLHGFTGSIDAWGDEILDALAARHRVLAVDLPGHGGSPLPGEDYGVAALAGDLARILDAHGIDRAHWIGYSMGGRMALAAAVLRPERVRTLVLESASPGLADDEVRARRRSSDEALGRKIVEGGMEAFVDRWMALPLFATQRRLPDEVRAEARRRRLDNTAQGLAVALRTLGTGSQPSFWEDLAGVSPPVLLLAGAEDEKFVAIGRDMAARLPHGSLEVAPGVGHTVHLEAPELWLNRVLSFLGG